MLKVLRDSHSKDPELIDLRICGRPASASSLAKKEEPPLPGQRPLDRCLEALARSTAVGTPVTAIEVAVPTVAPLRPLMLDWAMWGPSGREAFVAGNTPACYADVLTVSLVAAVSCQTLGEVCFRSRDQAQALRAVLSSAHDGNNCLRSTVEFWDGDVAGSAEGLLSIEKMSTSSYEISHNFLELSRVDAGATLSFEDTPEMRIVVEGPSSGAVISLHP
jgi:hypothetical protein